MISISKNDLKVGIDAQISELLRKLDVERSLFLESTQYMIALNHIDFVIWIHVCVCSP